MLSSKVFRLCSPNLSSFCKLTLSHLVGGDSAPQWEKFLNNSKTAQDIKMKFFKFNLTLMGVILHMMTILINLRCSHGNILLWMCHGIEKWRNLHIWQSIGLILLKFGVGGYFWILNPKSIKKFLYDVILTSKWREGKIAIYRLQKMHMTSLWRHLLFNFLKTSFFLLLIRDYQHTKIWFNLGQGKQSYGGGGGRNLTPRLRMY